MLKNPYNDFNQSTEIVDGLLPMVQGLGGDGVGELGEAACPAPPGGVDSDVLLELGPPSWS